MDCPPDPICWEICRNLEASDIMALSKVNSVWSQYVTARRKYFPKKRISVTINRKSCTEETEVQLSFNLKQHCSQKFYGVVLKQFIPRTHNLYKTEHSFEGKDLNQLALDIDYRAEIKYVREVDSSLHYLLTEIFKKVDLRELNMTDPTVDDLNHLGELFHLNRTSVEQISCTFSGDIVPIELAETLNKLKPARTFKLTAAHASVLPSAVLASRAVSGAKTVEVHLGHFSPQQARPVVEDENKSATDDEAICGLSAESLRLRGSKMTAIGANTFIKQWLSGARGGARQRVVVNIAIDNGNFKKDDVLMDIEHEERARIRDSYVLRRRVNGNIESAVVSWCSGMFTFEANCSDPLETPQYRLWF